MNNGRMDGQIEVTLNNKTKINIFNKKYIAKQLFFNAMQMIQLNQWIVF